MSDYLARSLMCLPMRETTTAERLAALSRYLARSLGLAALLVAAACSAAPGTPPAAPPASAAAAAPAGAPTASAPAALEPLSYGYTSLGANQWALYAAEARGYLAEQGIAIDENNMGSAAAGVQALASGSLDLTNSNPDPLVRAVASGADLLFLAGTLNPPIYSLYGQKDITSLDGLRGRTIIVGGPKDVTVYLLDRMFEPHGLKRGDYDMVYAGGTPERLRALESGAVQAAILIQPFDFAARREGYPLLIDTYDYVKNLPFSSFAVARGWLDHATNRERATRFLAAVYRGSQDVCDPAQKEAMIRILADKTQLSDDDARQTYELLIERTHSIKCDLSLTPDELQQVVNYIVAMGDLPAPGPDPGRMVDASVREQGIGRLGG
ncbi:MAG TPA: ABC transporter substrate-binding protein [Chloroflexota bacterium]|nr:ABC transporter substrate-binding protein [Chloroflexota bacterium]